MLSLFLRNLLFTILQPGLVAGLIPYWILGDNAKELYIDQISTIGLHHVGTFLFVIGFIIMMHCIISFAVKGRGTLSPADPTKQLVISGLYKFSRNPMYVGVVLMLIGEAIFFQSIGIGMYALFVFAAFHIFATRVEEPRLRKDFGKAYNSYCEEVKRWV